MIFLMPCCPSLVNEGKTQLTGRKRNYLVFEFFYMFNEQKTLLKAHNMIFVHNSVWVLSVTVQNMYEGNKTTQGTLYDV